MSPSNQPSPPQPTQSPKDEAVRFTIDGQPVYGRMVRLGESLDQILNSHDYPPVIATLLGEACLLAVIVGTALKFDGRLILQAQGNGPVQYVVADYDTTGAVRGFCRFDAEAVDRRILENEDSFVGLGAQALLGEGRFMMTIDPRGEGERYQGITPIEGESLSLCAEHYFIQSEQIPTQIRLSVAQVQTDEGPKWRGGGALIQAHASDESRGDTFESFQHIRALFSTLGEDELTDFSLDIDRLLFRLFHEDGVVLYEPQGITKLCRCTQGRVEDLVRSFNDEEREEMKEPDGYVHITCEYCSKTFFVNP
jgi:molecular chaperone Hsp33